MKKFIFFALFLYAIPLFCIVKQKDLDYFNNAIEKRQDILNLIADEYEGNKICEYIVRSVVINYVSEKLEKYMEKNQLENEATFYNLFNLFEKYNTEIYEQAMEFMSIHDEKGYEKYGANSYLLKQYFDKNCYQPFDNLLRKIENLTN